MPSTVMLYGADEFIGRLVASQPHWSEPGAPRLVLAGRQAHDLAALAVPADWHVRAFDWRDASVLAGELAGVDVVINAATPFEATVPVIREAALKRRCSYLDLNTELDVERKSDLIGGAADLARTGVVCGAGPSAVVTSLMVDAALSELVATGVVSAGSPLGAIRVAVSCVPSISRSSAASVWRALARDVAVGAVCHFKPPAPLPPQLAVLYESRPIGKIERSFDFGIGSTASDKRVCSAASLADLHVTARTARQRGHEVNTVEAYVASTKASRIAYPLGATVRSVTAPAYTYDTVERVAGLGFQLLPNGPSAAERSAEPFEIVLQIESQFAEVLLDWRLRCPNVYDVAAQLSARMAFALAQGSPVGLLAPPDLIVATMSPANPIDHLGEVVLDRRVLA